MFHVLQNCQVWNFSIISVLALTISNILLTIRLLHKPDCGNAGDRVGLIAVTKPLIPLKSDIIINSNDCGDDNVIEDLTNFENISHAHRLVFDRLKLQHGRYDDSRQFKYFDFAAIGNRFDELTKKYKVCLATQSSLERLSSLVSVASHWNGPISVGFVRFFSSINYFIKSFFKKNLNFS